MLNLVCAASKPYFNLAFKSSFSDSNVCSLKPTLCCLSCSYCNKINFIQKNIQTRHQKKTGWSRRLDKAQNEFGLTISGCRYKTQIHGIIIKHTRNNTEQPELCLLWGTALCLLQFTHLTPKWTCICFSILCIMSCQVCSKAFQSVMLSFHKNAMIWSLCDDTWYDDSTITCDIHNDIWWWMNGFQMQRIYTASRDFF